MLERFEPAQYSLQDLSFLVEHLGKPPVVAFRFPLAEGTHRNRLDEVLRTVHEHQQIAETDETYQWAGVDVIRDAIGRFLDWHERSRKIQARGAKDSIGALITYPSMYTFDEDGRAYKFAVDADSAECVRTEILEDGSRRAFAVMLASPVQGAQTSIADLAPWIKPKSPAERPLDKVLDERSAENKRVAHLRCGICGHTEEYDPANPAARRVAMARVRKHLKQATASINRHRTLLTKIAR
jgi:hypothetical protein